MIKEQTNYANGVVQTIEKAQSYYGLEETHYANGVVRTTDKDFGNSVPPIPVITAGAAPTDFKVNDPDIDLNTLFTIVPAGTPMTFAVDATGHATIVGSDKLHAVSAGDSTVTASADGAADETLTITVKAASATKTITGKAISGSHLTGSTIAGENLFTYTNGASKTDLTNVTVAPSGAATFDATSKVLTLVNPGNLTLTPVAGAGVTISGTSTVTVTAAPKVFKIANGTATVAANAVSLVAADGLKTILATDSADAVVPGIAVALVTPGDSTKLAVAMNADNKTVEMTPVAGQTGAVSFKITAAGYTDVTIVATLS